MLITGECLHKLQSALSGRYDISLCDGRIHILCRALPGRAVAAATVRDRQLWVVLDLDKPASVMHAREMVISWFAQEQPEAALGRTTEVAFIS